MSIAMTIEPTVGFAYSVDMAKHQTTKQRIRTAILTAFEESGLEQAELCKKVNARIAELKAADPGRPLRQLQPKNFSAFYNERSHLGEDLTDIVAEVLGVDLSLAAGQKPLEAVHSYGRPAALLPVLHPTSFPFDGLGAADMDKLIWASRHDELPSGVVDPSAWVLELDRQEGEFLPGALIVVRRLLKPQPRNLVAVPDPGEDRAAIGRYDVVQGTPQVALLRGGTLVNPTILGVCTREERNLL